jgi:hypothetical protein
MFVADAKVRRVAAQDVFANKLRGLPQSINQPVMRVAGADNESSIGVT